MVTFTYPYVTPTLTVNLPNPNLGDASQHENKVIIGLSMSGRVYTYIKTPTLRQLLLNFTKLSYTQMNDLKNLLYSSASSEIGYLDHESQQWRGNCINDPFEEKGFKNYQTITLEFVGIIP
jgi:hypothetical protein